MAWLTKKRKAQADGKAEFVVLIKQWIHQGFTYLDRTERAYRILWEAIPFAALVYLFRSVTSLGLIQAAIAAFLIVHTLNWIFNYNFWTCMIFTFPGVSNPGNDKTILYLQKMQDRMMKYDAVAGCMLYGSISRNKWHQKSDLDMRILRKPGITNGFKAYLIVFSERIIAVLKRQPLDLYLADSTNFLNKMRKDEFPIFLKNNDERLIVKYITGKQPDFKTIECLNNIADHEDIKPSLGV